LHQGKVNILIQVFQYYDICDNKEIVQWRSYTWKRIHKKSPK